MLTAGRLTASGRRQQALDAHGIAPLGHFDTGLALALHGGQSARSGKATTENVSRALKALAKFVRDEKVQSLALPRLATGVGGLEWAQVEPLVKQHLGDLDIPVVVYETYRAGVQADEQLG